MTDQRTGGMTTVGVLNLACGALLCLVGVLMFFGGGFIPFANAGSDGPAGGLIQFIGLGTAAVNLLLMVSGVGVMRVAAWGRSLSMSAAALGMLVYGAAIVGLGAQLLFVLALGYCVALLVMFFTPAWKIAFCGRIEAAPPAGEAARRHAA